MHFFFFLHKTFYRKKITFQISYCLLNTKTSLVDHPEILLYLKDIYYISSNIYTEAVLFLHHSEVFFFFLSHNSFLVF